MVLRGSKRYIKQPTMVTAPTAKSLEVQPYSELPSLQPRSRKREQQNIPHKSQIAVETVPPDVVLTHGQVFPLSVCNLRENEASDGVGNS